MEQIGDVATLIVLVLSIFVGVGIPRAIRLDRRDAENARHPEGE